MFRRFVAWINGTRLKKLGGEVTEVALQHACLNMSVCLDETMKNLKELATEQMAQAKKLGEDSHANPVLRGIITGEKIGLEESAQSTAHALNRLELRTQTARNE